MSLGDLPFADDVPAAVSRGFSEADLVYSSMQMSQAIDRMAVAITATLQDQNPVLLTVLPGGLYLTGQLMGRLVMPMQIGYFDVDSGLVSEQGGDAGLRSSSHPELFGRNVLLVADTLNCATVLKTLLDVLQAQKVASLHCAVMVEKVDTASSKNGSSADFVGVIGPNRTMFGCGLDFCGYGRNLPGLYAIQG